MNSRNSSSATKQPKSCMSAQSPHRQANTIGRSHKKIAKKNHVSQVNKGMVTFLPQPPPHPPSLDDLPLPIQSTAPSGEQNHGYATVLNGLTCRCVRGVDKQPLEFRVLVYSTIRVCLLATRHLMMPISKSIVFLLTLILVSLFTHLCLGLPFHLPQSISLSLPHAV